MKEKLKQKMLDEKLDFLPLKESLELYNLIGDSVETRFWWVANIEEVEDAWSLMIDDLLIALDEEPEIGEKGYKYDEFTFDLAPAYTYIDLL